MVVTKCVTNTICFVIFLLMIGCDSNEKSNQKKEIQKTGSELFSLLSPERTGISFRNEISNQQNFNILTFRNYYNGGGVGIGDINNDGLNDVYFTANMGPNKLYLNKGNLRFEDITEKAGVKGSKYWSTGVCLVDVNSDGHLDIYVCNSGDIQGADRENELFINNGDGTFSEKAKEFGLNDNGYSTHASFFDYDLDGDLDCFVLNNSYTDPQRIAKGSGSRNNYGSPGGDRLYRNDSNKFVDVTQESGIFSGDIDFGLGISVSDVNGDRYPDMYVSNDFWERDYLYVNNRNGTFTEKLPDSFSYISANSMGSDIADLNNDGYNDIFSTDMLPASNYRMKAALMIEEYYLEDIKWRNSYFFQYIQNALQINNGDGTFKETGFYSGVAATDWSWGALIFDMDNDGQKDIFVSNGIYHDITDLDFVDFISDKDEIRKVVEKSGRSDFRDFLEYLPHNKQKNFAFLNRGDLRFENAGDKLGFGEESYSNGSAFGDLDNDGDYDLVVNNVNMEAFIYENGNSNSHYIKIKLRGPADNFFGIGAQVKIFTDSGQQVMESYPARGFQSSVDCDLIFGLGRTAKVDSLVVLWPDLSIQSMKNPAIDTTHLILYRPDNIKFTNTEPVNRLFTDVSSRVFSDSARHLENNYLDYDHERLIPHASSTEGPRIVKGDVNGDRNEDFILLGAFGQPDQLFIFRDGKYLRSRQKHFESNNAQESVCGVLFDSDKDGDLDYIVGSGGNEYDRGIEAFSSRFYVNDGKGNFVKSTEGPIFSGQIGCIKPNDFDNDGDTDLFIGASGVPGNYGLTPRSLLLRNENGKKWTNVTSETLEPAGMVKDAEWFDFNGDGADDLIVVGEWMPVTVFLQDKGVLRKGFEIPKSNGWWNVIEMGDLDGDGDQDFVLGNWGENMKLQASELKPLNLYRSDFDNNGRFECILEWQFGSDEKAFPFASKKDLTGQLPMLKKKSLKYQDYAKKQVHEIIPKEAMDKATKLTTNNLRSSMLINNGKSWELRPLPFEAQLSPLFAISIADVDADNVADILFGGNYYKLKPEIGRLDGFNGGYLRGIGNGKFVFVDAKSSGIRIQGEVRDIARIKGNYFFARNNQTVVAVSAKSKTLQ